MTDESHERAEKDKTMSDSADPSSSPCHLVTLSPCYLVILIGYRCTGKTTVAQLLAERLRWAWVDADVVIETQAGHSIRDIFAAEGEAGFREREAAALAELCRRRQHVIATGGGVVLRESNRQLLRAAGGYVVWLTADAGTIWQRLGTDPSTAARRPTLTCGGLAEVQELLQVREPLYRICADAVMDTVGRGPEEVTDAILATLLGRE